MTVAVGGGFRADELYAEVRTAWAYRDLTPAEWDWALDFVTRGGPALAAYPEYRRVVERDGLYTVPDRAVARRHRMSIGTITSDAALTVQYVSGGRLGTVEESFVARLRPGERFVFAGRTLELAEVRDMTAWVRRAKGKSGAVPALDGRPHAALDRAGRRRPPPLEEARDGVFASPEMAAMRPILELQARWSAIPAADELLIERLKSREGHHLFLYPFEGRLVHEGLAALLAYRISRLRPITFTLAVDDYGIELLSPDRRRSTRRWRRVCSRPTGLAEDIPASLNAAEMAKRQFRDIARVAGLLFQGFPGAAQARPPAPGVERPVLRGVREVRPGNLLLHQAHREVLEQQLERSRLGRALARLSDSRVTILELARPTPLAFPLLVARMRDKLSSESLADRVRRMQARLEKAAGRSDPRRSPGRVPASSSPSAPCSGSGPAP